MSYRRAVVMVAVLLGLGACAEYPTNYRADVYEDGSYYRPADAGRGDYYYAPEPDYRDYDFYDGSFGFGPPFYSSFGGFCLPRFIYCSPLGYGPFGDPFHRFGYDPFWNGYYGYPSPYRGRRPHRHDESEQDNASVAMPPMRSTPPRQRVFQAPPRPRELRRAEPAEPEDRPRRRMHEQVEEPG